MRKRIKVYRAVLDTNIFIRSILSPSGLGANIIEYWKLNKYVLIISYEVLEEIADVLLTPKLIQKYNYSFKDVESLLNLCKERAIVIDPPSLFQICRDPDDDKIINCAIAGRSHFLVSNDADLYDDINLKQILFEYGVKVIQPEGFIQIIGELE